LPEVKRERPRCWRDYPAPVAAIIFAIGLSYGVGRLVATSEFEAELGRQQLTLGNVQGLVFLAFGDLGVTGTHYEGVITPGDASSDAPRMRISDENVVIDTGLGTEIGCVGHLRAVAVMYPAGVRTRLITADGEHEFHPEDVLSVMGTEAKCREATRIQTLIPRQLHTADKGTGSVWPPLPADWAPAR